MDYEKDVSIIPESLDVEWLEQPSLMLKYCQHAALCKAEMDNIKEEAEIKKAELDKEIRTNPDAFKIGKITEATVLSAIQIHSDYQQRITKLINARYEYEMAQAAVRAIDQKKTALENLVKLHGMSYFAGPQAPRDITKEWENKQKQKQTDKKVKITRKGK